MGGGDERLLLLKMLATGVAGIMTGALTFVSFVDTRTFLALAAKDDETTIKRLFPLWWPFGKSLMAPLCAIAGGVHGATFYLSKDPVWMYSGLLLFSIGPYTAIVLGEDISALRKADPKDVTKITRRFCYLHHVRLALTLSGFCLALNALAGANGA